MYRRRPVAGLQGFCRGELPSPRSRHCRRRPRSHHPRHESPPRTPPSASTSRGVSRTLAARRYSSSLFSFPSPLRTFGFLRTHASSHDRRRPPLPEASRTERRSTPVRASVSIGKIGKVEKGDTTCRENLVTAIRRTYQVIVTLLGLDGEAIDLLGLEIASDSRPNPSGDLLVRRGLVGHSACLEVPRRDTGTHLVHFQWSRHQREYPSMMDH